MEARGLSTLGVPFCCSGAPSRAWCQLLTANLIFSFSVAGEATALL